MAFFKRWWREQTDDMKAQVQKLVDENRLQFANAGFSMSDEATVHYEDFLNNMKAGHDFLKQELGYRPKVGWHIDPFGHHSATAALFSEMGFDAWFFARMDYQDKAKRLENKEMEWIWRPFNESLGSRAEIFTHMMYHHYSSPPGFGFWATSNDDPVVDDDRLETYNVEDRAKDLHDYLIHMSDHYKTNHLLVPFGDDFKWENAQMSFLNLDKLIKYVNENYDDVNLFYSTPNDYVEALNSLESKWPTKYDDLFPYADQEHVYWTGFFTSRPNIKGYVREASSDLIAHASCLAFDYLKNGQDTFTVYNGLFEQMGVLQHHDAVSGTEKQKVADNYVKVLDEKLTNEKAQFLDSFKRVSDTPLENLIMCKAHNSTYKDCPTNKFDDPNVKELGLHIINPMNARKTVAQIPIPNKNIKLYDISDKPVVNDVMCNIDPSTKKATDECMMYFEFEANILGGSVYKLKVDNETSNHIASVRNKGKISTSSYSLTIKPESYGKVEMKFTKTGQDEPEIVDLEYMYYTPHAAPVIDKKNDGAYIFRPQFNFYGASSYNTFYSYDFYDGEIVKKFYLHGKHMDTIITVNSLTDFIEIETKHKGIEWGLFGANVILRLTHNKIKNQQTFYTDSMGLELQKRVINYRPTWDLDVNEPIAGNYYPIGHGIYITDEQRTFELLNDRSQGGSSLDDGQVETMIHRRLYHDDHKGLHEALDERQTDSAFSIGVAATTKHWFRFYNTNTIHSTNQTARWMQRQIDSPPVYVFGDLPQSQTAKDSKLGLYNTQNDLVLPDEIKLVMLPNSDGSIFVRLENTLDLFCNLVTITINVQDLATAIATNIGKKVSKVTEVSNTGLYTMDEMKDMKMRWTATDFQTPDPDYSSDVTSIELSPQRIRSFVVEFKRRLDTKQYLESVI